MDRTVTTHRAEAPPEAYPDGGGFMRVIAGFVALALIQRLPPRLARRLRKRLTRALSTRPPRNNA